ncbi:glycosyltransferase family 2 protein [Roseibacillus ishigakijimensis]|uniref:Glycosyltransferase family 2 protein n=1 Tax=Roseibacillus ishigakijimensis TaxID=454146 RepID=A0A934RU93_9BACT|nr:glycosyltransferase family 2 protein [Roseibacillus ishigakijimensis]MBK1835134.1 glycosyltransferase family 2 protein [Roseibacillus ishigakijimensis]
MKLSQLHIDTVSFIVPAMNEEATLETLFRGISEQMEILGHNFEVLFIDDGSSDRTWSEMERLATLNPGIVRSFRFRCNMGKADALSLGYEKAIGDVVITMDADLQDDPQEIPRFLSKLQEGYGIVTGHKKKRFDPWHKVLPSRVFNTILSKLVGVKLHDHNCGFKAYRREVAKQLPMYGEMHRMVPALASFEGYETAELIVQHHPRAFGKSKYGVKRILSGLFDMVTISFLKSYRNRPMHFFGRIALLAGFTAGGFLIAGLLTALLGHALSLFLTVIGMMSLMAALLSIGMGLQMELGVYRAMLEDHTVPVAQTAGEKSFQPRVHREDVSLVA